MICATYSRMTVVNEENDELRCRLSLWWRDDDCSFYRTHS